MNKYSVQIYRRTAPYGAIGYAERVFELKANSDIEAEAAAAEKLKDIDWDAQFASMSGGFEYSFFQVWEAPFSTSKRRSSDRSEEPSG